MVTKFNTYGQQFSILLISIEIKTEYNTARDELELASDFRGRARENSRGLLELEFI